jgi:SAM-dependent methyltransferase
MRVFELHPTRCAICHTEGNATELYAANFDPQAFNPVVFSARRLPDRIHYRMVKCNTCGLVRSDPVADLEVLAKLYTQSTCDYDGEITNLRLTYGQYLDKLAKYGVKNAALLEIGCGSGFFLEEALSRGYDTVRGIEPSVASVEKANPQVRPHIICDIMRPGLLEAEQFDVICMFQVLDHIFNPGPLIDECFNTLKPGGLMLCINHNIEAISARLLKDRSPIIDIQHTYLYSPDTMRRFLLAHHFQIREVGPVSNRYSLYYLLRLVPLPIRLKRIILASIRNKLIGQMTLALPLGNLYLIAQKPNS